MNNKEKKDNELLPPTPPETPSKEKKFPILESVELTKTQKRLYVDKRTEIEAMKMQAMNIVITLGMEIKRNLVEMFSEELDVELGPGKYGFDPETMSFIDANELKKKMGQPRMTFPSGKTN